jgi:uncharacterized cofD-like protein
VIKLLYPGMHIKRWIVVGFLGLLVFLFGTGVMIESRPPGSHPLAIRTAEWFITRLHLALRPGTLGLILTLGGAVICLVAFAYLLRSLMLSLDPDTRASDLPDIIYRQRKLAQGRRIVVLGGGTGLSTMLRGLKKFSSNITAIVTVTDDGGSSGKLKRQLNIPPPGDIRSCLVALADAEPVMTELFQYRFRDSVQPEKLPDPASVSEASAGETSKPKRDPGYGEGLRDHAFGNLLIAAMCAIYNGDFERGIRETSRVLNIRGRVLPTTVTHVGLRGEMEDGSILDGETTIASSPLKIRRVSLTPDNACPLAEVLEAIERAEIIVLGPGSVFTSVIPNLLVPGVPDAIRKSKAKKVYVCNVMTQPGETKGFSAYDHVRAIEKHARMRVFDYVMVNTARPDSELLEKYRKVGSVLVEPDADRIKSEGYRPLLGNYINQSDVVRHDSNLLAAEIMRLLYKP